MSAIGRVTAVAIANGWEVAEGLVIPGDRGRTYRKAGMVFKVPAHSSGAVAFGILTREGVREAVIGKGKEARIVGLLKTY